MFIAVMVSLSPVNASNADRYFFNQVLSYIASRQVHHHYYICTDAPQEVVVKAANVTSFHIPYIHKGGLLTFWSQIKHRQMLKKLGIEFILFIGAGLYQKSQLPYCVLVQQGETAGKPSGKLSKVLHGAKHILTLSEAAKTSICQQYQIIAEKVDVVYAGPPKTPGAPGEELHAGIKERYTKGCEYFLYSGSFEQQASLLNLLKAFSIFKKRQKTSWKLIMVNRESASPAPFIEALRTYKYREEVVVLQENEDMFPLLSAAYAFVYPGIREDYGLYILEALHFGLPVLTASTDLTREIAGEAALWYDGSINDLAEKMMTLYKDETLKGRKVAQGKELVSRFSWEITAEKIWMGCSK